MRNEGHSTGSTAITAMGPCSCGGDCAELDSEWMDWAEAEINRLRALLDRLVELINELKQEQSE